MREITIDPGIRRRRIMPEKIKLTVELSQTELRQLQSYIRAREQEWWYWLPRDQFEKRHNRLRKLFQMDEQPNKGEEQTL